jgi:hypothetical protein
VLHQALAKPVGHKICRLKKSLTWYKMCLNYA